MDLYYLFLLDFMFLTIIVFILILGFLVLVHELGHFLTARRLGVKVEEFGLGFPPAAVKWEYKGTRYSLNFIPLGGFVKIKGEDAASSGEADSFASRPVGQRAIIAVAGVVMNIVVGWLILVALFATAMPMELTPDLPRAYVLQSDIVINAVLPDSPAAVAGLKPGDKLRSVAGSVLTTVPAFKDLIAGRDGVETSIGYRRGNEEAQLTLTPRESMIGAALSEVGIVRMPLGRAALYGTIGTGEYLGRIAKAFVNIVQKLWGNAGAVNVGGPVAIAVATNDVVDLGLPYVLLFTAILSFNLAIINILPFPALDGGRLVFFLIEAVRRRSPPNRRSAEVEAWFHRAGFILLLLVAALVTYHDILRLLK